LPLRFCRPPSGPAPSPRQRRRHLPRSRPITRRLRLCCGL